MSVTDLADPHPIDVEATRRDATRQAMLDEVPARYSGRAHWAFVNLTTTLGIALSVAHHLSRDSWLGRRALVGWLRQHHTRHHELALMEKGNFNVSFPLWDWLLGTMLPEMEAERSAGSLGV